MTSGGRRDAREDVPQTSAPSMSPVEVWLYLDLFTTQPQHSTAMAAWRTCLTRRAVAWTNCNWASMVNWIPPLIAATYRTLKTSGKRRRPPDVCPIHESCRSLTLLRFKKHLIVSLTQTLSKWLSELPACYYAEVISLHMSKVVKNLRLQQAPTLHFLDFIFIFFLTVLYNSLELLYSTVS